MNGQPGASEVDVLITRLTATLASMPESGTGRADMHAELAQLYLIRATEADDHALVRADLNAAIRHGRTALGHSGRIDSETAGQLSGSWLAQTRLACGFALADRFYLAWAAQPGTAEEAVSARSDRDEAIEMLSHALPELDGDEADRRDVGAAIGRLRYARYNDQWPGAGPPELSDLNAAVELLTGTAGDDADHEHLWTLVTALGDRVDIRPSARDLDQLIDWARRLLDHPDTDDDEAGIVSAVLAESLLCRAEDVEAGSAGRKADLDAAIAYFGTALRSIPVTDPDRPRMLYLVTFACWLAASDEPVLAEEVDRLAGYARQAWQELPPGHDARGDIGVYLAVAVQEQMIRPGGRFEIAVADFVIGVLTEAVSHLRDDPAMLLMAQMELGHFLVGRGQEAGSAADLAAAKPWLSKVAAAVRAGDPLSARFLFLVAADMFVLAATGMVIADIDGAIELLTAALRTSAGDVGLIRGALGLAYAQRAGYTQALADLDAGLDHLRMSFEQTAASDPYRLEIAWILGSALLIRFQRIGDIQDREAARYYLSVLDEAHIRTALGRPAGEYRSLRESAFGLLRMLEGIQGDATGLDDAVRCLRTAADLLPRGHPNEGRLQADLGLALMVRAGHSGGEALADLADADTALGAALELVPPEHGLRPLVVIRRAAVRTAMAAAHRDPAGLRGAIGYMTDVLSGIPDNFGGRVRIVAAIGAAWQSLFELTSDPAALDAAAYWLDLSRGEMESQPGHPASAPCTMLLAKVERGRGQPRRSRELGLTGLRARGREVLLQSGTRRGLLAARMTASEANEVAAWCLADDKSAMAVEALELGRALVLHAATSADDVVGMLIRKGHVDLAQRWLAQGGAVAEPRWGVGQPDDVAPASLLVAAQTLRVPDDLRARALDALAGPTVEQLLAAPTLDQIGTALRATGADALVYLLGPGEGLSGRAILVLAPGASGPAVRSLPLPGLDMEGISQIRDYTARLAAMMTRAPEVGTDQRQGAPGEIARQWNQALEEMAEWAWPAVMLPLLRYVARLVAGRLPRIVLVPIGVLGQVPWHAARDPRPQSGGRRYACGQAVISYAASGRQLMSVAARPARDVGSAPVVVGNPAIDLTYAGLEAQAIRDRIYPSGRYLGYASPIGGRGADGPGRSDEVLGLLPGPDSAGASMIHLACHAVAVASAPAESHLVLAEGARLTLEAVLRQASGRPGTAPGGLISLAACGSDLAMGEPDEALTLATAFLAAGAATVVGTRWEIPDGPSALMMFMFHHFLNADRLSPRDALRMAQLWMVHPGRTAPPEMPAHLAREVRHPSLAELSAWAAVTHQGR